MKKNIIVYGCSVVAFCCSAGQSIFDVADTDRDGRISREEYTSYHQSSAKGSTGKKFNKWFNNQDRDGNGFLSPDEAKGVRRSTSGKAVQKGELQKKKIPRMVG